MRGYFRDILIATLAAVALWLTSCKQETPAPAPVNEAVNAAKTTARDAYVFGYPLVLADVTRAKTTNVPHPQGAGLAPVNQFAHNKTFPDATFTDVVSPNADTLYSTAWLDLGHEPMVLSVPDTHGRYYLMPMLDAWTNVFASPGKRTTGTGKANFAITGPHWAGSLPSGLKEIKSPTDMVLVAGRTQANGKADFPAVNAIQAQYIHSTARSSNGSKSGYENTPCRNRGSDGTSDILEPAEHADEG